MVTKIIKLRHTPSMLVNEMLVNEMHERSMRCSSSDS